MTHSRISDFPAKTYRQNSLIAQTSHLLTPQDSLGWDQADEENGGSNPLLGPVTFNLIGTGKPPSVTRLNIDRMKGKKRLLIISSHILIRFQHSPPPHLSHLRFESYCKSPRIPNHNQVKKKQTLKQDRLTLIFQTGQHLKMLPDRAKQTRASQEEVLKKNLFLVWKTSPERDRSSAGATVSVTAEIQDRELNGSVFFSFSCFFYGNRDKWLC